MYILGKLIMQRSKKHQTVYEYLCNLQTDFGNCMALVDKYLNYSVNYNNMIKDVGFVAKGLISLGLKQNEHISQFSENNSRWMIIDLACQKSGIVNAVRGSNAPVSELKYIYNHSDSVALISDSLKLINNLEDFLIENKTKFVIYTGNEKIEKKFSFPCLTFDELIHLGKTINEDVNCDVKSYDVATIVYSSGTTGTPKGVMLTHGNLVSQIIQAKERLQLKAKTKALSVLPIWHMYERTCEYYLLSIGCAQFYTNLKNFKKDLLICNPDYLILVPRIWESIYSGIISKTKALSPMINLSKCYRQNLRIVKNSSLNKASFLNKIKSIVVSSMLFPLDFCFNNIFYKKISQKALGKNFKLGISGGGALARHIEDFFEATDICVCVGYGLTETAPILNVRSKRDNTIYSVGEQLKGTKIKIVDTNNINKTLKTNQKGLVLAKGPQIMRGYYKNEEATKKVLLKDGWFITGDLGFLTYDNKLVLNGRLKDTIVLSNGENIEPESLEHTCLESEFINQIVIVGQDKNALSALVVPDFEVLNLDKNFDIQNSFDLKQKILNDIRKRIKNRENYREFERINDIRFVNEPFSMQNGLMTPTAKIKKHAVLAKHKELIDSMYK